MSAVAVIAGVLVVRGTAAFAQGPSFSSNNPASALPGAAQSATPLLTPASPRAAGLDAGAGDSVVLDTVRFEGATALSPAQLEPAWRDYRGRAVSLTDLRAIAARAEARYDAAGYPFVAIVVPAQVVTDGQVRLRVIEARISDLTVLGLDPVARRQVTAAFEPLVGRTPLAAQAVQRAYNNAQAVPGLSVGGALRAGSQPGGMDLVLQARRRVWRGYVNVNNFYSDPVGPWGMLAGAEYYGESLYGDRTTVQIYSALDRDEQRVIRLAHYRGLNAGGLSLNADVLAAEANPRGDLAMLDLATNVFSARLELGYPLLIRPGFDAKALIGLEATNQKTQVFGNQDLTEDRLRIATARVSGGWSAPRLGGTYALEVRQGLSLGDSSRRGDAVLSRDQADPRATVFRATFQGEARLPVDMIAAVTVQGQATRSSLAAPEEFSVGNLTIGRGYDPGAAFGDKAVGVSAELRTRPFPVRQGLTLQPFVFADGVKVWNKEPGAPDDRWIASSGAGLRFVLLERAQLDLTYAVPASAPLGLGEPKPQPKLLANLTIGFPEALRGLGRVMTRRQGR